MKRPVVTLNTKDGAIPLRMDADAVAALDSMAQAAGVSRSAMAERLIVEGLNNPDISEVREEVRAARRLVTGYKARLMAALGEEMKRIEAEVKGGG
jgi:hypothetical protein